MRRARGSTPRREALFAAIAVCLAGLSLAAAGSEPTIWEDGDQIVQLVSQDDSSAPSNDHPVEIASGEVATALQSLRVRSAEDSESDSPVPVFTQDEIDDLSQAIATGLGIAAPSQDLIFHVIGSHRLSRGLFARRNRVSAGRIFMSDDGLNVIFGQIQTPYRKRNVYGQTREDFHPRNYGARKEATRHDVVLLTSAVARLFQDGAEVRNDWIVLRPGAASAPMARGAEAAAPADAAAGSSLAAPSAPESDGGQDDEAVRYPSSGPSAATVEQRLEALKRLRDRGLISEEAYETRVKEILQEL